MAVVLTYFRNYYVAIRSISVVLTIIVLLGIINRDMTIEGKLPWAIIVALLPILGIVLYVLFSRNYASRTERKLFAKLPKLDFSDVKADVPLNVFGQINYLKEMGAPTFSHTETKYFESGETYWQDLLVELDNAKKFIFLEFFIVERGKMLDSILEVLLRKIDEGVEVRMMYDDVGSLPHVKYYFCRRMRKLGINCVRFGKLKPFVSAVYNNRDHRKIVVIDGKVGYTGGINLSDEYINETHPFGYWKDTAVKITGDAVASLCIMFLQMFDMAQHKTESFESYIVPGLLAGKDVSDNGRDKGLVIPFGDGPKPIYQEYVARNVYLNLINQAEKELYITTPYLIVDEAFTDAIKRAAQRGVDVHIVIPGIPDKKAVYCLTKQGAAKLFDYNVKMHVYTPGFIHAKGIIADSIVGVVGTINLDYRSFMHHYEDGIFMYDTEALKELRADMLSTIEESQPLDKSPKLNFFEKIVCIFANVLRPLL
ncbi:MAG: cardiolipin synthase [Corallococcus sp.]|nr:cardiolipin synthase [Bacillota bacterium]MCM1533083.1 cardiolipin synthase [Corallococcus sp.]